MTAKEAITLLQSRVDLIKRDYPDIADYAEALLMAIKALLAQGQENDLISREAAIDAIVNTPTDVYSHDRIVSVLDGAAFRQNEIIDIINALPSAQPDPDKLHLQREQAYVQGWEDARLIDRQAAISAVNTALFPKINTAKDAEKALLKLPSVQPQIIRCKDCKHYVLHVLFGRSQGWCERLCDEFDKSLARGTEDDDFCSRAERR